MAVLALVRVGEGLIGVSREVKIFGRSLELLDGEIVPDASDAIVKMPLIANRRLEQLAPEPILHDERR